MDWKELRLKLTVRAVTGRKLRGILVAGFYIGSGRAATVLQCAVFISIV